MNFWDRQPTEAALFLFWVKGGLFGIKPRNQFLDPIDSQFVVDRRGEPSIVLDAVVEFSALVTYRGSAFVSPHEDERLADLFI
jgi:hypothetical protein